MDSEQKLREGDHLNKMVRSQDKTARNFVIVLQLIGRWMNSDPVGSTELLTSIVKRLLSSADVLSFQSVTTQVQRLQDQANSMKILFRFIVGKLPPELSNKILGEITEVLVARAFDHGSGGVYQFTFSHSTSLIS